MEFYRPAVLSPATDTGQNTQHFFSLVTKAHLNWWWFLKSQLRINKTIHRENQMFAFDFYTNLSSQTVLTAGQLHHSYTNLWTRDHSQAFHVAFGSCHLEQEEFEMANLWTSEKDQLRQVSKWINNCSSSAELFTWKALHLHLTRTELCNLKPADTATIILVNSNCGFLSSWCLTIEPRIYSTQKMETKPRKPQAPRSSITRVALMWKEIQQVMTTALKSVQ